LLTNRPVNTSRLDDPLFQFRVRAMTIVLPLTAAAALGTWGLLLNHEISVTDLYLLPLIAFVSLLGSLVLALDVRRVTIIMPIALGMLALYELVDLYTTFTFELQRSSAFGQGVVWYAVVIVMAFIVLSARNAVRFGIVYLSAGLVLNLISFRGGVNSLQLNGLLQFHAANVTTLVLVWVLAQLQSRYADMEYQARTDVLTGLFNRRFLQVRLEGALKDTKPLSVVMLDVDFFKRVNDSRGHAFGDEVLREIAFTLSNHIPKGSSLARWGGEEFLVILSGFNAAEARDQATQLCAAVGRAHPGGMDITLSAGVAQRKSGDTVARLLERADEALYRVKESGRNRATLME
jgi:diguanylate cyclase (GGDEF)-like protein